MHIRKVYNDNLWQGYIQKKLPMRKLFLMLNAYFSIPAICLVQYHQV